MATHVWLDDVRPAPEGWTRAYTMVGTAIPLRLIKAEPPTSGRELLVWLKAQEDEHRAEIDAAWAVIIGHLPRRAPR